MKQIILLALALTICGCNGNKQRATQDARQVEAIEDARQHKEYEEMQERLNKSFRKSSNPVDSVWIKALNHIKLPDSIKTDKLINVYFKYNQTVKGYEVTARWMPFDPHCETGLLVMNFRNKSNGQSFRYTNFEKYNSPSTDRVTFQRGFKGYKNGDVYYFDYIEPRSDETLGYYTPFQFVDIDFDGKDEFVINDWYQGQGGNGYYSYKINGSTLSQMTHPPFDDINNSTSFDKVKKQIIVSWRSGADIHWYYYFTRHHTVLSGEPMVPDNDWRLVHDYMKQRQTDFRLDSVVYSNYDEGKIYTYEVTNRMFVLTREVDTED